MGGVSSGDVSAAGSTQIEVAFRGELLGIFQDRIEVVFEMRNRTQDHASSHSFPLLASEEVKHVEWLLTCVAAGFERRVCTHQGRFQRAKTRGQWYVLDVQMLDVQRRCFSN